MTRGKYTRDFYFIPTILYHNGDGIYASLELAWLKYARRQEKRGKAKWTYGA